MGINYKIKYSAFLFLFFSSVCINICTGQDYEWSTTFSGYASVIENIQTDNTGTLYVYGRFTNTVYWDSVNFSTSSGVYDIFRLKYNDNHQLEYSTKIGSTEYDSPGDLKLNNNDEQIFSGVIGDNAIFYDTILSSQDPDDFDRVFLAKYTNNNNRIWIETINDSISLSKLYAVDTDNDGNIYVMGATNDQSHRHTFHTLIKYDTNGKQIWQKFFPESYGSDHCSLYLKNTDVVIAFQKIVINNYDYNIENTIIIKADSSGNEIWRKEFTNCLVPHKNCLTVDDSNRVYVITKNHLGNPLYWPPDNSFFKINKLDEYGNLIPELKIKADYGIGNWDGVFPKLITSSGNNLYISANYRCKHILINNTIYGNDNSSFIAKFSSGGDLIWFRDLNFEVNSFALNPDESVYVCGNSFIRLLSSYTEPTIDETGPFIYPNPGYRYFNIANKEYETDQYNLEIFNVNGQLKNRIDFDKESIQIDLSTYGSGIYFFKFQNDRKTIVKKVIVY
jgi:hypothetical protein